MIVSSGAKWYTASDNQREYAVSFDLTDLEARLGEDKVSVMGFNEKLKALNNMADAYVVAYLAKEGDIPQEFARKRLAELSHE